jgi:prevent-host-death family protein
MQRQIAAGEFKAKCLHLLDEVRQSRQEIVITKRGRAVARLLVSAISVWELGMLEAKGRIRLKPSCEEWVKEALATPGLALAPITPEIALESSRLPGPFHGDPADRIIAATARRMGAQLMTRDQKLIQYARKCHLAIL